MSVSQSISAQAPLPPSLQLSICSVFSSPHPPPHLIHSPTRILGRRLSWDAPGNGSCPLGSLQGKPVALSICFALLCCGTRWRGTGWVKSGSR